MERIKAEIIKFLEIRFSSNYQGEDADGHYKGVNFDYHWTSGELAEVYVPTEGLTMDEIWEVMEYVYNYGYKDENGKMEYDGFLKDWDGISIAMENVRKKEIYDANGTFKANDGLKDGLSAEEQLELLQVVTEHMLSKKGEDEDYDAFYARCRRLTRAICIKYAHTDCSVLGASLWEVAEQFCDIVRDVKRVGNLIATEYYCE